MTEQQRKLLDFIDRFTSERGYAPSYIQMADELDLKSKSGVHRLVGALLDRGYLRREGAAASVRSLVVVKVGQGALARYSTEELWAEIERRGVAA